MDNTRFDMVAKLVGKGASRRAILKGLLGLGGAAAGGTVVSEGAKARPIGSRPRIPPPPPPDLTTTSTTTLPPCAAGEVRCARDGCCAGTCTQQGRCCETSGSVCGEDCCADPWQCCDGECCPTGYTCLTQAFSGNPTLEEETCCPTELTCDQQCCDGECFDPGPGATLIRIVDFTCCPAGFVVCEHADETRTCIDPVTQCCVASDCDLGTCEVCAEGQCVPGCTGCQVCNPETGICEDDHLQCSGKCQSCIDGACVPTPDSEEGNCIDGMCCEGECLQDPLVGELGLAYCCEPSDCPTADPELCLINGQNACTCLDACIRLCRDSTDCPPCHLCFFEWCLPCVLLDDVVCCDGVCFIDTCPATTTAEPDTTTLEPRTTTTGAPTTTTQVPSSSTTSTTSTTTTREPGSTTPEPVTTTTSEPGTTATPGPATTTTAEPTTTVVPTTSTQPPPTTTTGEPATTTTTTQIPSTTSTTTTTVPAATTTAAPATTTVTQEPPTTTAEPTTTTEAPCDIDADCDDGNPCTVDACDDGQCVHKTAEGCCTVDAECPAESPLCCNNTCLSVKCCADAHCDDGNPCTSDACVGQQCVNTPLADGTECGSVLLCCDAACVECCDADDCPDDSNACTLPVCEENQCGFGAIGCDDGDPCTLNFCNPITGCFSLTLPNCCRSHADCDDGNACTADSCNPTTNRCEHLSFECSDFDPCTESSCDPASGCVHTPIEGCCQNDSECANSDACTIDTCDLETNRCVFTEIVCDDSPFVCTTNEGVCTGGECSYPLAPEGTPCPGGHCDDIGNCNLDCDPPNCDGAAPICHTSPGVCEFGQCVYPPGPVGLSCGEGRECNSEGHCCLLDLQICTSDAECCADVCVNPVTSNGWCGCVPTGFGWCTEDAHCCSNNCRESTMRCET